MKGHEIREIIGDTLTIALGLILLFHFGMFWTKTWIRIGEPNEIMLTVETVMALAILGLGIERYIDDFRRRRRR